MTNVTVFLHPPPPVIGVCGVVSDRAFEAFEQNLDWLEAIGVLVERIDPQEQPEEAEAASRERVFLALHPPALKAVLHELAPRVRKDAVVVSLAPVLILARLSEMLGGFTRLARVLPNAPSIARAGFNPVAFADGLPGDARAEIEALLDSLGVHPVVPEDALEAYAILAAMGPTYFWFQWQTLRDLAASFGLAPAEADRALRAMLDGAVRTFFDADLSAEQVLDLVPVKPLAEAEPQIRQVYLDVLPRLYAKLKGA